MEDEIKNDVRVPSPDDPPGTRYVKDGEGNLVRDRRPAESKVRSGLIYGTLALILLLTIGNVYGAVRQHEDQEALELESKTTDFELRQSQRIACEQGQNELRQDVRHEFVDLKRDGLIPFYTAVRNLSDPGDEFTILIDEEIDRLRRRALTIKERIPDNDCPSIYPLLDDPRTEENEEGT